MPLYSIEKPKDGSTIAIWEQTETEAELQEMCSLTNSEREEMLFITHEQRRKERLTVHLLLHQLLNKKFYLGYHDNGRPFLQNEIGDISIAHTRRFVCIIHHVTGHVGIDIESLDRDFSAVEKKVLAESERDYLSEKNRNLQLCLIWGAKEAIYKYVCETGVNFAGQIEVGRFTPRRQGKLNVQFIDKEGDRVEFILHYRMVDDHAMVWVVK
ncbi:MAG: 4'-phosphopantetheinyl transferase superfamily protein [Prevotellaceae bacterium]|jgi:phosphopantetheinyl transferase|nr:4'-phosphopantetheinyl transferase superfamily protein [Prevotellaceae bacterium]